MISVLASIRVKQGQRSAFLDVFKANIQKVREEAGCIEYFPAVDIDSGLPVQCLDPNVITIVEKWQSLEALTAHLATPHMLAYRENVKDMVEDLCLKVLQQA